MTAELLIPITLVIVGIMLLQLLGIFLLLRALAKIKRNQERHIGLTNQHLSFVLEEPVIPESSRPLGFVEIITAQTDYGDLPEK